MFGIPDCTDNSVGAADGLYKPPPPRPGRSHAHARPAACPGAQRSVRRWLLCAASGASAPDPRQRSLTIEPQHRGVHPLDAGGRCLLPSRPLPDYTQEWGNAALAYRQGVPRPTRAISKLTTTSASRSRVAASCRGKAALRQAVRARRPSGPTLGAISALCLLLAGKRSEALGRVKHCGRLECGRHDRPDESSQNALGGTPGDHAPQFHGRRLQARIVQCADGTGAAIGSSPRLDQHGKGVPGMARQARALARDPEGMASDRLTKTRGPSCSRQPS